MIEKEEEEMLKKNPKLCIHRKGNTCSDKKCVFAHTTKELKLIEEAHANYKQRMK